MIITFLDRNGYRRVHISRKYTEGHALDPLCNLHLANGEPVDYETEQVSEHCICQTCLDRLRSRTDLRPTFFQGTQSAPPWRKSRRQEVEEILNGVDDLPIKAFNVVVLPDSSRSARAVLSVSWGPLVFHECMLLGDVTRPPQSYTLHLPGKHRGADWVNLIECKNEVLLVAMEQTARSAYLEAAESIMEKRARNS